MSKLIVLVAFLVVTAACGGGGDGAPVTAVPQTAAACSAETARAVAPVLQGGGIDGAASYSDGSPHPIVLIQPNGDPHPSCVSLPSEWAPVGVADTQLVALIGDEEQTVIERCSYQNGPDVVRYQSELTIEVLQAADGVEVASGTLQGTSPRLCDEAERQDLTSLSGEPVADAQIISWLARYVAPPEIPLWSRVPDDEAIFGGSDGQGMSAVVAGGPGLVAVGWDTTSDEADAAVWTSVDGRVWSRVLDDGAVFGGSGWQVMNAVVAGGPGLVAVGRGESGGAAVWTSVDGRVWSRVPHDDAIFGGGQVVMNAVVAGGPGLVAVGSASRAGIAGAAVWTSVDGREWSPVPHDEAIFGDSDGDVVMNAVVAGGPGLVAVGSGYDSGEAGAVVWTSVDGRLWSRVPDMAGFGDSDGDVVMNAVAAGGPGLVAVGLDSSSGEGDAAVWTSVDGREWFRVPDDEEALFGGSGRQVMNAVVAGGPGLVAVGSDSSSVEAASGEGDAAVWISVDGWVWFRVPSDEAVFGGPGGQVMNAVVAGGPGLVAVGSDGSGGDDDAEVWVGSPHAE